MLMSFFKLGSCSLFFFKRDSTRFGIPGSYCVAFSPALATRVEGIGTLDGSKRVRKQVAWEAVCKQLSDHAV